MTANPLIYFVDDDPKAADLFKRFCRNASFDVQPFRSPVVALEACKQRLPDLLISDLKMPEMSGIELLGVVRELDANLPTIIITGFSTVDDAVEALRLGVTDFIKKPYDIEELLNQVELLLDNRKLKQENLQLREALHQEDFTPTLIGESEPMRLLKKTISNLASVRCNVIVFGESGTGKELIARDLHRLGPDSDKPFTVIDCGALADNLLESELFGYEKGAFTGADRQHIGKLEQSSGGTVFLDEIGNISDAMQTRLLRVIQEQEICRIGGHDIIRIDVRFVAASNRDLGTLVQNGKFRHDLYHRLNVITIQAPPLRERSKDIILLARHFASVFALRHSQKMPALDAANLEYLTGYSWPGNVRELKNAIERFIILGELNLEQEGHISGTGVNVSVENGASIDADLPDLRTLEQRYIQKVLDIHQNNREKTASVLGINKSTLWRKLQ